MNVSDVENYVVGNLKYALGVPEHEQEQILLRQALCKPCLDNGKCLKCGCPTPKMFYAPNKIDKDGKWAKFLDKNQWEALKENYEEYYKFFKQLGYNSSDGSNDMRTSVPGSESGY